MIWLYTSTVKLRYKNINKSDYKWIEVTAVIMRYVKGPKRLFRKNKYAIYIRVTVAKT